MHVSVQLVQTPSVSISALSLPPSPSRLTPTSYFSKPSSLNSLSHCLHNSKTKSTTKACNLNQQSFKLNFQMR